MRHRATSRFEKHFVIGDRSGARSDVRRCPDPLKQHLPESEWGPFLPKRSVLKEPQDGLSDSALTRVCGAAAGEDLTVSVVGTRTSVLNVQEIALWDSSSDL